MEIKAYIIDPTKEFDGSVLATLSVGDDGIGKVQGLTLEEYRDREGNQNLIAVPIAEFETKYWNPYYKSLQGEWEEISKERWEEMLTCLPPLRWVKGEIGSFFVGEEIHAGLYRCCIDYKQKYYTALRPITMLSDEIRSNFLNQIKE